MNLDKVVLNAVMDCYLKNNRNKSKTARELNISRAKLYRYLIKIGVHEIPSRNNLDELAQEPTN